MASPKPTKKPVEAQIDFYEALRQIMTGQSVTKLEWGDRNIHGIMADSRLKLHKADGKLYDWILSDGDIAGDDYVVL